MSPVAISSDVAVATLTAHDRTARPQVQADAVRAPARWRRPGRDVKALPGVREGIGQPKYAEADAEIARAAKMLDRETALVDAAAAEVARISTSSR